MAKKKRVFSHSPIRKAMKKVGATNVARNSVDLLITHDENLTQQITQKAIGFAKLSNRKKINSSDIDLAIKYLR